MERRRLQIKPALVFANQKGEITEYPGLLMAGSAAGQFYEPEIEDLIELPSGSELFTLPGRLPVGIEAEGGEAALLAEDPYNPGEQVQAVAAFMAPAHTALYNAAFLLQDGTQPVLPLFAYTAVGWADGTFWVAAFRSDADVRQDANQFDQATLERKTRQQLAAFPKNRLIQHLGICCLSYGCPAARNYFLGRWEAPLPCSPVCNAACVGCISLQPSGCCPATQERITFVPGAREIAEVAIAHLQHADRAIVSFGQGCEGEPLLQAKVIEEAIRLIRRETNQGTINLNTNGSLPEAVERLALAGLDSIRLSLNSAQLEHHRRYYQPKGFSLEDVCQSLAIMKRLGRHVSLNYFILPGCTDDPAEFRAFCDLVDRYRPDLIQLRNLNMDPDYYRQVIGHHPESAPMGMRSWVQEVRSRFPWLKLGYYNPPLR